MNKRLLAASALVAGVLLAGCSAHPGAAVVYKGETLVSESQVDEVANALSSVAGSRPKVLGALIQTELMEPEILAAAKKDGDKFVEESVNLCAQGLGVKIDATTQKDMLKVCEYLYLSQQDQNFAQENATRVQEVLSNLVFAKRYIAVVEQSGIPDFLTASNALLEKAQGKSSNVEIAPEAGTSSNPSQKQEK